jgi:hypothetical protein
MYLHTNEIERTRGYIPGPGKLGIVVDARGVSQNSTSVCLAVPTNYLLLTELTARFTSPVATEPPAHFAPTFLGAYQAVPRHSTVSPGLEPTKLVIYSTHRFDRYAIVNR